MRMGRMMPMIVVAFGLLLASAHPLEAQRRNPDHRGYGQERGPAAWIGVEALGADPRGAFGEVVDAGFGLGLELAVPVAADGALVLKVDGGFINYGMERSRVCFSAPVGCRIDVDLTTSNNIAYVGIGPELVASGGAIRPYVNATAGLSYFFTHSSLEGDDTDAFAGTTNFDDLARHSRLGAGFRTRLGRTVLLDLGLQYHRNGVVEYLREGDIVDHPDGTITLHPRRTEADLMVYRIGLAFGVGGDDDRRARRR